MTSSRPRPNGCASSRSCSSSSAAVTWQPCGVPWTSSAIRSGRPAPRSRTWSRPGARNWKPCSRTCRPSVPEPQPPGVPPDSPGKKRDPAQPRRPNPLEETPEVTMAVQPAAQEEVPSSDAALDASSLSDTEYLAKLGYKQELKRDLGLFSAFGVQFSSIAVVSSFYSTLIVGLAFFG